MVAVGIWWPSSAPFPPDASWLEPIVAYTPWSVTITLHTRLTVVCDSALPCVGSYLSTISIPVQLSEPLEAAQLREAEVVGPPGVTDPLRPQECAICGIHGEKMIGRRESLHAADKSRAMEWSSPS